jgi:hypothetical protein
VSEENSKVAMARTETFPSVCREICKDSTSWIPFIVGGGGVNGTVTEAVARKLTEGQDSGQWWVYFVESVKCQPPGGFLPVISVTARQATGWFQLSDGDRASNLREAVSRIIRDEDGGRMP